MNFKKGDKVICVNTDCASLTKGKQYEILHDPVLWQNEQFLIIINDNGSKEEFFHKRFRHIKKRTKFHK